MCATHPYSSWPAVSKTSINATSSSMTACFLYESIPYGVGQKGGGGDRGGQQIAGGTIGSDGLTFDGRVVFFDEMALDEPDG